MKRSHGDLKLFAALFAMLAMAYLSGLVGQVYQAQHAAILVAWEGERGPSLGGDDSFSFSDINFSSFNRPLWFLD